MNAEDDRPRIRSYVLRAGRMTDLQRQAYAEMGAKYRLEPGSGPIEAEKTFGRSAPLVVEIGFGMGAATAIIARERRDTDFIGIEVHRPGIGKLMAELEANSLTNVRILEGDAVEALERHFEIGSLAGIHLFFPDPWPKKRHHKRRLMQKAFADLAFSRLKAGGYLYMVTDWEEYAQSALEVLSSCTSAKNAYEGFSPRLEWRPVTKFERKAEKAGRAIRELFFLKA